ncbi:hypothetical protein GSI_11070 [Ganoderma sinense ZZ0214-1]|uniref:Uncharacterized protein n=1 Tax=Ganoderma sinense ZZ0214-1 TaxID=1077348 RepID=A0A2G8RZ59_9APHY|nr:hypothetical protein GSI_11070 [Ganoderma sinense ZZ0214-1]
MPSYAGAHASSGTEPGLSKPSAASSCLEPSVSAHCHASPPHRSVYLTAISFRRACTVLGALDTAECCADGQPLAGLPSAGPGDDGESPPPGPRVLSLGLAACVLSLATNLLATLLVGYKAWRMRRRLRGFLLAKVQVGGTRSRTWKVLSLLVESGAVYCATWVLIVAFQADTYRSKLISGPPNASPNPGDGFQGVFRLFVNGCLVPLIVSFGTLGPPGAGFSAVTDVHTHALQLCNLGPREIPPRTPPFRSNLNSKAIYPTFIIVLVAFDKSHIEKSLAQHDALAVQAQHLRLAVPLAVAVAVDCTVPSSSSRDRLSRPPQSRGMQVIGDWDSFNSGHDGMEDAGGRISEERKAEAIV